MSGWGAHVPSSQACRELLKTKPPFEGLTDPDWLASGRARITLPSLPVRVLAFVTDAYGGRGGIATVNRDVFRAWMSGPPVDTIRVIPRVSPPDAPASPAGVEVHTEAARGAAAFLRESARSILRGDYDAVFAGHLHLAPVAALAAQRAGVPWVLLVHGFEAWGPPHWEPTQKPLPMALTLRAARTADRFVAVSDFTRQRFATRLGVPLDRGIVVPNGVELGAFAPGPPRTDLLDRYGLHDRTVLVTLARLAGPDRKKGIDEIIEVLPSLAPHVPNVSYLVCGSGPDRERLEAKAASLGVSDRVVFTGFVAEEEKADHYRLGDAFVMPSGGEGFGIVFLEAMACGIPVVASSADASIEAVRGGELGVVVDPSDPSSVLEGIRDALARPKGVPDGLDYFSHARFAERWREVAHSVFSASSAEPLYP